MGDGDKSCTIVFLKKFTSSKFRPLPKLKGFRLTKVDTPTLKGFPFEALNQCNKQKHYTDINKGFVEYLTFTPLTILNRKYRSNDHECQVA